MNDVVEVVRSDATGLERKVWRFYRLHNELVVDSYEVQSRTSKRQRFKTDCGWRRLYARDSTLRQEEVPLPDDVKVEAIEALVTKLRNTLQVCFQD